MERNNVGVLLGSINKNLAEYKFEVVVVDDNSADGTAEEVRRLTKSYGNTKLIVRSQKMGLGSAYRTGYNASSNEVIVEMDADLSHNPEEITKLISGLENGDVVIGSRYVSGGNIVGWNWKRRLISWTANRLAKWSLGLKPKDVTSGFRVYSKDAFEKIISHSKLNGYSFQIEVLYLAKKLGFQVKEVPITFTERARGKSKLGLKEMARFAFSIISLRFRRLKF